MTIKPIHKTNSLATGTVVENYHKDYLGKIKVTYSFGESGKNKSGWIPVSMPYVSKEGGMVFLPEIGSEVVIGFVGGNLNRPIVLGSLWTVKVPMPPILDYEKNTVKMIQTKAGHKIVFNEEPDKESIEITSKKGIKIHFSDENETLTISDEKGKTTVKTNFKGGELSLDAENKVILSVGGTAVITLEKNNATLASGSVTLKGSQSMKLEGQSTSVSGSSIELAAQGSLKTSSSGMLEISGSMVKIN